MTSDIDEWSATDYNTVASFVYSDQYTRPVLDLLAAKPGERIVDFGCGTGELTLELARVVGPTGFVFGIDASENMIQMAKANGLANCIIGDLQSLQVPETILEPMAFDAVFSNATLHWCKQDPGGVLESAKHLLKAGGRFVGEFGGFTNTIGVRSALHQVVRSRGEDPQKLDPWYFPSPSSYQKLLESHGFRVVHVSIHPRLTPLNKGDTVVDWLRTFARRTFLSDFDESEGDDIMKETEKLCEADCRDDEGNWAIMYTRLRFVAYLD